MKRVNLYSSTNADRTINCFLSDKDEVNVLEETADYFFVEKADGKRM